MSGLYPAVEYLKDGTNRAMNTKSAIIFMAEANETISRKIKEIEEKVWKEIENEKPENFHFDPNEIQPIVLKDKEDNMVSNDKFKEKQKIKEQERLEREGKIVKIKPKDKEEREIE